MVEMKQLSTLSAGHKHPFLFWLLLLLQTVLLSSFYSCTQGKEETAAPRALKCTSLFSLLVWRVGILSGGLSPLCYLWENRFLSLAGIFIIWISVTAQPWTVKAFHSKVQLLLLLPACCSSHKWHRTICSSPGLQGLLNSLDGLGISALLPAKLPFQRLKAPCISRPTFPHILSLLGISAGAPLFTQPFSWLHFYLQTPLQLLIYLSFCSKTLQLLLQHPWTYCR